MPEYTPTTENVRDCYVYSDEMYDGSLATPVPVAEAEFDRWLAARDRENRAIGWDEGWDRGVSYERWNESEDATNPYRGDNR